MEDRQIAGNLSNPPDGERTWAPQPLAVKEMFGRVVGAYDRNNAILSLGRHQAWRRAAAEASGAGPGSRALDAATGTGDLAAMLARRGASVTAVDFCPAMLDYARSKHAGGTINWVEADACHLPFDDGSFDAVTISFGLRNIAAYREALAEFRRVLKVGGRLVVLEFAEPRGRITGWLARRLIRRLPAAVASVTSPKAKDAYDYLSRSIESFLTLPQLAEAIGQAGLSGVVSRPFAFGAVGLHVGSRE
jgi:demethylmenaquinone methyltransferase / 2-methoxy-6-polyprenyl-1,4-benzoquinol methylase